ncbi:MAG: flagellar motor switch protein FliG [Candidatus Brocadiia bacterium]
MDGRQKVATLLLVLEPEVAADLLSRFSEEQRHELVDAMMGIDYVDPQTVESVLEEFEQMCQAGRLAVAEPETRVRALLEKSLGEEQAAPLVEGRQRGSSGQPFAALERLEAEQLVELLGGEHPQTIAIVLPRVSAEKAGRVLALLPESVAGDVVERMVASEQGATPEVLESIGRVLGERAQAMVSAADPLASSKGRLKLVADVLSATSRTAREAALGAVRDRDEDLGNQVRQLMFLFDDLPLLEPTALRDVVGAVDTRVVALALKTASDEVKEAIFNAISSRAAETLREEQELLGPRPLSEVEDAQQQMVDAASRLVEEGKATVQREGEKEMV